MGISAAHTLGFFFGPMAEDVEIPGVDQGPGGCDSNRRVRFLGEHNALNALGAIPIIGIASGVFRIISASKLQEAAPDDAGVKAFAKSETARGVVEILGLGIIPFVADIFATIGHAVAQSKG